MDLAGYIIIAAAICIFIYFIISWIKWVRPDLEFNQETLTHPISWWVAKRKPPINKDK